MSESLLIKLQALRTATLLVRDSCETCENLKSTLQKQPLDLFCMKRLEISRNSQKTPVPESYFE